MKIVNFEDFSRMPAGTIFAPYTPCVLDGELEIKVDAGYDDPDNPYFSHPFNGVMPLRPWIDGTVSDLFHVGAQEDASFEIYDGDSNDYCDYKMFLIFEEKDIDLMIEVLKWAKAGCPEGDYPWLK